MTRCINYYLLHISATHTSLASSAFSIGWRSTGTTSIQSAYLNGLPWYLLSYIFPTIWAILLLGIGLSGVERGVSALSVHKKEPDIGIFRQAIALVFEKDWIFHERPTAVLEYWERDTAKRLTNFPQGSRWRTSWTNDSFPLYLSSPVLSLSLSLPCPCRLTISGSFTLYLFHFQIAAARHKDLMNLTIFSCQYMTPENNLT